MLLDKCYFYEKSICLKKLIIANTMPWLRSVNKTLGNAKESNVKHAKKGYLAITQPHINCDRSTYLEILILIAKT